MQQPSRRVRKRSRKRSAKQKRIEQFNKLGGILLTTCFGCLVIGRVIVSLFFPHIRGQGIPAGLWPVLIIIWTIGIAGISLLLTGWFLKKFE